MSAQELYLWTLVFSSIVIGGSLLLALMPPGEPRVGRVGEWLTATSASCLLGFAAFWLCAGFMALWWSVLAVLVVLCCLRFFLRPLPLAPRHEPPLRRETTPARLVLLLAWAGAIATQLSGAFFIPSSSQPSSEWIFGLLALAVLVLVDWALQVARCRALVRAAAIAAFAAVTACAPMRFDDMNALTPLFFTAGAACTIPWYRRGDRRALALAAVYFAATVPVSRAGWLLAAAGMLTLVIGTPGPSRRLAGTVCAISALLFGASSIVRALPHAEAVSAPFSSKLYFIIGFLFAAVLVARWMDLRRLRLPAWNPSGAGVGHERAMLLRTLLFALIFAWLARALRFEMRADFALLPALFVLVPLFGSSLERLFDRA